MTLSDAAWIGVTCLSAAAFATSFRLSQPEAACDPSPEESFDIRFERSSAGPDAARYERLGDLECELVRADRAPDATLRCRSTNRTPRDIVVDFTLERRP